MKCIAVSSSISNFAGSLYAKYSDYEKWSLTCLWRPCIFFGCYHVGDYLKLLIHRGQKKVFWCGSDILALQTSMWRHVIWRLNVEHVCENSVEWKALLGLGMTAMIQPMFFGDVDEYTPAYEKGEYTAVFLSVRKGRETEYGVYTAITLAQDFPDIEFHVFGIDGVNIRTTENVYFHGNVTNWDFDEMIRLYNGALRLNSFDGFGEVLAKSILLGQYPISVIPYGEGITHAPSYDLLVKALEELEAKTEPNPHAEAWRRKLSNRVTI